MRGLFTAAVWLGCALWEVGPAAAITGGEIMEKVQERLERSRTFSARFEKQFYWAALDKSRTRHGAIHLRRPGHFRVELDNGDVVVADGEAVWSYVARNEQVVVSPYGGELRTPWQVFVDYAERYVPLAVEEGRLAGRACYMLVLKPQVGSSTTEQMKVWVDKKKWWLLKVEKLEANGDITTYVLKDHRENEKIDEALFRFQVPAGVDMVDRRAPVRGDE